MKKTLFITGLSGFIGKNIFNKLDFSLYDHIYAIGRKKPREIKNNLSKSNLTFVKADIFEIDLYRQYLNSADVIIHLAAVTGKVPKEEYFRTNRDATRVLLDNCNKDRIERFVLVSSIAAKFKTIKYYYYAQSKLEAEADVKAGMVPYTILRPTIVLGQGSAVFDGFRRMIQFPIVPIFGNGLAKIQPIFVEDLADCILNLINSNRFINETIEIGGPEEITIESFIKSVHHLLKGGTYRAVHLPASLFAAFLSVLERHMLSLLPFTAGQLSSFTNDGTSEDNPFLNHEQIILLGIDEMLSRSLTMQEEKDSDCEVLTQECRLLGFYLIGSPVDAYTEDKYIQGHQKLHIDLSKKYIDQFLLKKAFKGVFWIRLADIYAGVFFPQAVIRKKILLMIAILECQQATYVKLDSVDEKSPFRLFFKLGQKILVSLIMLMVSMFLIGPFHGVSKLGGRSLINKQVS